MNASMRVQERERKTPTGIIKVGFGGCNPRSGHGHPLRSKSLSKCPAMRTEESIWGRKKRSSTKNGQSLSGNGERQASRVRWRERIEAQKSGWRVGSTERPSDKD